MKGWFKGLVVSLYCHGWLSLAAVSRVFRAVDLKGA